jgi:hypothetical protein
MPTRDRVIRFRLVTDAASSHLHLRSSSRRRSSSSRPSTDGNIAAKKKGFSSLQIKKEVFEMKSKKIRAIVIILVSLSVSAVMA